MDTYEKKYKEVLERAKSIKDSIIASHNKESASYYTGFIDNIFPELAESEDERIRKWLIDLVKRESGFNGTFPSQSQVLSWLEKQKEPSDPDEMMNHPLYLEGFDVGRKVGQVEKEQKPDNLDESNKIAAAYQLGRSDERKQKEQKPVERATMRDFNYHEGESDKKAWSRLLAILNYAEATSDDTPGEEIQALTNWIEGKQKPVEHLSVMDDFDLDGNPKQKSTKWSDVDEMHRSGIVRNLKFLKDRGNCSDLVKDTLQRRINWLESLCPQQKQEWSEEDEKRLNAVIELLENTSAIHPNYSHRKLIIWLQDLRPQSKQEWSEEDEANFKWFDKFFRAESVIANGRDIPQDKYLWFKSLRPQKNWKPSEEQMDALRYCYKYWSMRDGYKEVLESLYNDLKKLKED